MTHQPNNVSAAGVLSDAKQAFEAYLNEQKQIIGMQGLHARPSFIAGYQAGLAAASDQATGKPVAWIRYRSDGCFEGPIMDSDSRMCDTRRSFWTPLYAAPYPAAREAGDGVTPPTLSEDVLMQAIADTAARGHVWASRALSNFRALLREAGSR